MADEHLFTDSDHIMFGSSCDPRWLNQDRVRNFIHMFNLFGRSLPKVDDDLYQFCRLAYTKTTAFRPSRTGGANPAVFVFPGESREDQEDRRREAESFRRAQEKAAAAAAKARAKEKAAAAAAAAAAAKARAKEKAAAAAAAAKKKREAGGFMGIQRQRSAWRAQISFENKTRNLGSFKSAEEAARMYDRAVVTLRGIQAAGERNFPDAAHPTPSQMQEVRAMVAAPVLKRRREAGGFTGIERKRSAWVARISFENKNRHLGSFKSAEEAARMYDRAVVTLRGIQAAGDRNFPDAAHPTPSQMQEVRAMVVKSSCT